MSPKKIANRLNALDVKRKGPGMHLDGAGLYLQVTARGRSWVFRFASPTKTYGEDSKRSGQPKVRDYGIGPTHTISLSRARDLATEARGLVKMGRDPIEVRDAEKKAVRLEAAKAITFKDAAGRYIAAQEAGWRNPKSADQWTASLETYAGPVIGNMAVADIDVEAVLRVIDPIWRIKPVTARRIRGRIERILDWAKVRGYRSGDNPAHWRESLKSQLPELSKVRTVTHFPALPYTDIGAFIAVLRTKAGVAAQALEFTILTAGRTGEVIGARWDEFDLQEAIWTIPAGRMKVQKAHRVPLSPPAKAIVQRLKDNNSSEFIFPGRRKGRPLSNMAMLKLLKRMDRTDLTVHGFRSTFRDWCAEQTNYAREVAESALAHKVTDDVEAAYRRGDLFDKRRRLMAEWAKYCDRPKAKGKVVPIKKQA